MNKLMDLDSDDITLPVGKLAYIESEEAYDAEQKKLSENSQGKAEATAASSLKAQPFLTLEQMERNHIFKVLSHTNGNKSEAAGILGITIKTLYNKLHSYAAKGIDLGANKISTPKK